MYEVRKLILTQLFQKFW